MVLHGFQENKIIVIHSQSGYFFPSLVPHLTLVHHTMAPPHSHPVSSSGLRFLEGNDHVLLAVVSPGFHNTQGVVTPLGMV